MNRLKGNFAGVVFDNLDPKKIGRVKILAEGAGFSTIPTPWAFPKTARFKGDFSPPDVGDNVWVEFEGDPPDPNRPAYSPGYWSEPQGQSEVPGRAREQSGTYPKGTDTTTTSKGVTISEPPDPFAAVYPKNRVIETAGGHLIEIDDTPGAERIHVFHKSGSFVEFHPDGKVVVKSAGDKYAYTLGKDTLHSAGDLDLVSDAKVGIRGSEINVGFGTLRELIDERVLSLINGHVHLYTPALHPGPPNSAPTGAAQGTGFPLTKTAVATSILKGS